MQINSFSEVISLPVQNGIKSHIPDYTDIQNFSIYIPKPRKTGSDLIFWIKLEFFVLISISLSLRFRIKLESFVLISISLSLRYRDQIPYSGLHSYPEFQVTQYLICLRHAEKSERERQNDIKRERNKKREFNRMI